MPVLRALTVKIHTISSRGYPGDLVKVKLLLFTHTHDDDDNYDDATIVVVMLGAERS